VATTANISFGYDAAGHRTSMSDGMGSVSYNYNNLAQLASETRNFTGVGSYTLSYGYNLAGELASITNPWGAQVSYGYDKAGRVTAVNGSGYYGISNYASALTYRAFGAIKGMNYANGRSLSTLMIIVCGPQPGTSGTCSATTTTTTISTSTRAV
jgi:YD repeat-containing protein